MDRTHTARQKDAVAARKKRHLTSEKDRTRRCAPLSHELKFRPPHVVEFRMI